MTPLAVGYDAMQRKTASTGLSPSHIFPQSLVEQTPLDEAIDELNRVGGFKNLLPLNIRDADDRNRDRYAISYAVGGEWCKFTVPHRPGKTSQVTRTPITEFSGQSRFRLLSLFNKIDRDKIEPDRLWFVTLTYPGKWPPTWAEWKKHLQNWKKRLERVYGRIPAFWKLEPQRRGAPHFHLILLVPPEWSNDLRSVGRHVRRGRMVTSWKGGKLAEFRRWLARSWYEVVGSGDERHARAGTNCEPMEGWHKAKSYCAKYVGKECSFVDPETGEPLPAGRFWGVWHKDDFPIEEKTRCMGIESWTRIRRGVRRYLERKGYRPKCGRWRWSNCQPRGLSGFVPASVVGRLVEAERCPWADDFDGWDDWQGMRQRDQRVRRFNRELWLSS